MANTKNAMLRTIVIDRCLSDKSRWYSTQDIMDECNRALTAQGLTSVTSLNTIRDDINAIKDRWMIEVDVKTFGKNRLYRYADPSFSIFKSHISHAQKEKFAMALALLREIQDELFR